MLSIFALLGSLSIFFLAWVIAVIAGFFLLLGYAASRSDHDRESKLLHEHIRIANTATQQSAESQNEQLASVAHQLKTPLTSVIGYASMLLEEDYGKLNAAQIEAVTAIEQSGKRAQHLADGLLKVATLEHAQDSGSGDALSRDVLSGESVHAELVHLRKLVQSILAELKQAAERKHLYVYLDQAHQQAPLVRGNESSLREAILNVLDNAITYTEQGGVIVRMVSDRNGVRLSVHDTGAGIHPDDQPHVFDKFYRGEQSEGQNIVGNGLGMYISRKIIEQHGGSIWIESEGQGKGSTFHIWLPIEKPIEHVTENFSERFLKNS